MIKLKDIGWIKASEVIAILIVKGIEFVNIKREHDTLLPKVLVTVKGDTVTIKCKTLDEAVELAESLANQINKLS